MKAWKLLAEQDIAERLITARINAGIFSITEAAKKSGVTRSHIYHLETGELYPHITTLCKLCKAYGVTPNDILL